MWASIWTFLTVTLPGFFKLGAWLERQYDHMIEQEIEKRREKEREERSSIVTRIERAKSDKERNALLRDLVNLDK